MTQALPCEDALRQYLAIPTTRSYLTAYVRRRGCTDEADDVVQTVMCDALAVARCPTEPSELRRWLTAIARHKVVDFRRRRARSVLGDPPDAGSSFEPESRDLLGRIDHVVDDAERRRCLGWMLREHEGDRLLDIAREEAIAADSLRQRICRLRRDLRAHFASAIIAALFFGGSGAALLRATLTPPAPAIVTQAPSAYDGTWRVTAVTTSKGHSTPLETYVVIAGRDVRLLGPAGAVLRTFTATVEGDQISLASDAAVRAITVGARDADHLTVESDQGTAQLARVVR